MICMSRYFPTKRGWWKKPKADEMVSECSNLPICKGEVNFLLFFHCFQYVSNSDGLQPNSDGLQPDSNGLQPNSDTLPLS